MLHDWQQQDLFALDNGHFALRVGDWLPQDVPLMAKTNLLNTSTSNLMELLGNGRLFRVPPYQRDYSWGEEQWEDLWNDLLELKDKPDDSHYLGALVVEAKSDRDFEIIDGQQRLATLSLFCLAVIEHLEELANRGVQAEENRERARALRTRFIGEKDPASLVEASKLNLNATNNTFYQDYLVQLRPPLNPRGLSKSNQHLWSCFKYFREKIRITEGWAGDGEALARLLAETVGRQLMFIRIAVDDELNAYTVFETLNARGLELTSTDLLKNYLFSRVPLDADRMALHRRWQALIDKVGAPSFPEFLRYHLLTQYPKVRTERLFKLIREQVKTPAEVFALLDKLDPRGELFSALKDPGHGYWQELPEARQHVRDLNFFRVRQMTPLLFTAWEKMDRGDFVRVLRHVKVVSFRYTVVSSLNTNALEPVYHEAARAVDQEEATRAGHVAAKLRSIYVNDERFVTAFSSLDLGGAPQGRKVAKYILANLQSQISGRLCDPDIDAGTIEHVLPQNPSQDWTAHFPPEAWESHINRIGNLTLLEVGLNRELANAAYPVKVAAYPNSVYELTKEIPDLAPEVWTPALVAERQRRLALVAVQIWRSHFD